MMIFYYSNGIINKHISFPLLIQNNYLLLYRREVKEITPDADHKGYTIKARHWEPRHYVEAMKGEELKKAEQAKKAKAAAGRNPQLLFGAATGFALGAVLIKKVLPMAGKILPEHASLIAQITALPLVVYGVCVVLGLVVMLVLHTVFTSNSAADTDTPELTCHDLQSVGSNGRMVTVEEMAKGGSGGASVMQGDTVAVETIRARYVVNAAGCYSVRK